MPPVVCRRRSTQPARPVPDLGGGVPAIGAGGGRRDDQSIGRDPETDEAQVAGGLSQRALDGIGESGVLDLSTHEPGRDEQERHDEQAADQRRDAESAHRSSSILGEHDAADGRSQPDDEGRRGNLADGALGVPEAEVVDLAGDVAQTVVQTTRTLRGPTPSGAGLEAAGDESERGAEVETVPASAIPLLDDRLVGPANRVAEDRLERVGVDQALKRELERRPEFGRLLVPGLDELRCQPATELRPHGLRVERLDRPLTERFALVERRLSPGREDAHREHDACHREQHNARGSPHRTSTVMRHPRITEFAFYLVHAWITGQHAHNGTYRR